MQLALKRIVVQLEINFRIVDFKQIETTVLSADKTDLSTDQKYLRDICTAVTMVCALRICPIKVLELFPTSTV